jgi:hypothetical protein
VSSRRKFLQRGGMYAAASLPWSWRTRYPASGQTGADKQRFLLVGLCGSENPTRANFPFVWAAALSQAGHEVRIELAGDATVMMRSVVAENVIPVGWPPISQVLAKVVELKIPIFV